MAILARRLTLLQKFSVLSFLCILSVIAAVCVSGAAVLGRHLVQHDATLVAELAGLLVTRNVPAETFRQSQLAAASLFDAALTEFARTEHIKRLIVYDAEGRVLWSDDTALIGRRISDNKSLAVALRGDITAHILGPGTTGHEGSLRSVTRLEEVYVPVRYPGDPRIVGVLEIYRDPPAFFAALDRGRGVVWILGGAGGLLLYVALFVIVRNASATQARLEEELATHARALEARVQERTQDLFRKTQSLSILQRISQTLSESLDLQDILHHALNELLDAKGFEGGWITLRSAESPDDPFTVRRGVSDDLIRRVAERADSEMPFRQVRVIDLETMTEAGERTRRRVDVARVIVAMPIDLGDRRLGALHLVVPDLHRVSSDDIQLIAVVAHQVGVAIGNAQLYAATREREREGRILYETTRHLGEEPDPNSLLRAIGEGAVAITRGSYGGVGFPDGDDIVVRRLVPSREPDPTVVRHKIAESLAGFTFASGQPQIANDIICSPLTVRGRVIGVLFVCNKETGPFAMQDLVLLTTFAEQAAVALDNARLRADAVRREREASILYGTSTRLHGQTEVEALLATIVHGATEIADASGGAVGRVTGQEIVLRPLVGFPSLEEIRVPVVDNAVGLTYATGEPIIVNTLDRSPCAAPIRERMAALGVRNFLCVPLKSKNTVVGVIKVCNKRGGADFTEDDLRLVTTFATHAALAIDNARLFEEIKTTKEFLERLIDSSTDAILTLTPRGVVTFINRAGRRMLCCGDGAPETASSVSRWVRGVDDLQDFGRLLTAQERIQNYETQLYGPDQTILTVNVSASVLRDPAGQVTGFLAIVRDVTDLRKLHDQMIRSERLAAAGLLAAGVAHEVGNPLTCISNLAQVLLALSDDVDLRHRLEDIQVHVGRIEKIVQDLTQLTRPAPFRIRESSLQELVEDAVQLARHNPAARTMKIEMTIGADLPHVHVSPDQLLQVFLNIILNAAETGGDLGIRAVSTGDSVRVTFQDTGGGLNAEALRRMFDPFYSTKDPERHMGLGLFVSHEIVRLHGGTLVAESQPGAGCAVTVTLPAERVPLVARGS
jgi:two-component system NtrC family sensor kinase